MPKFIEGLGLNAGLTKQDLENFATDARSSRTPLREWIRTRMNPKIPAYQEFRIILTEDISGLDLSNANLEGLIAYHKKITGVNFSGANLNGTFFSNITFDEQTDFTNIITDTRTMLVSGDPRESGTNPTFFDHLIMLDSNSANHGSQLSTFQLKQIKRSKALNRLLSSRSVDDIDVKKFSESALVSITKLFFRSFTPTYDAAKDILLIDNAALVCRYRLATHPHDSLAAEKLFAISKIYKNQAKNIIEDLFHGLSISNDLKLHISSKILEMLEADRFFKEDYLLQNDKDLKKLAETVRTQINTFLSGGHLTKNAFDISINAIAISGALNSWKETIKTASITQHLADIKFTKTPSIQIDERVRSDSAWSPYAPSSWPALQPHSQEMRESIKLKKEALYFISNCLATGVAGTSFLSTIGITNSYLGFFSSTLSGGIALATGLYARNITHAHIDKIKPDSVLLQGQLGDRFLELGAKIEYAIKPNLGITVLNAAALSGNMSFISNALGIANIPGLETASSATGLSYSLRALLSDTKAANRTLAKEKTKDFSSRIHPAQSQFKSLINGKLFWNRVRKKLLIGATITLGIGALAFAATMLTIGAAPVLSFLATSSIATLAIPVLGTFGISSSAVFSIDNSLRKRRRIKEAKTSLPAISNAPLPCDINATISTSIHANLASTPSSTVLRGEHVARLGSSSYKSLTAAEKVIRSRDDANSGATRKK